jgi:hypothetical protein
MKKQKSYLNDVIKLSLIIIHFSSTTQHCTYSSPAKLWNITIQQYNTARKEHKKIIVAVSSYVIEYKNNVKKL